MSRRRTWNPCADCGQRSRGKRCKPCSSAHRHAEAVAKGNPTREAMNTCWACGAKRRMKGDACAPCRRSLAAIPTYEHALTGGRWVNDRGVQRWVPDTKEAA